MRKIIIAHALLAITTAPSFAASATSTGIKAEASASMSAKATQAAGGVKGADAAKAAADRAK